MVAVTAVALGTLVESGRWWSWWWRYVLSGLIVVRCTRKRRLNATHPASVLRIPATSEPIASDAALTAAYGPSHGMKLDFAHVARCVRHAWHGHAWIRGGSKHRARTYVG